MPKKPLKQPEHAHRDSGVHPILGEQAWAGIDFGARRAGTTRLALVGNEGLHIEGCAKGQDVDAWLVARLTQLAPERVYLDAPLSLPSVYCGKPTARDGVDFMFRRADRDLGAMSPLFLGGLTARAMQLAHALPRIAWFECYPAALVARRFPAFKAYKRDGVLREALGQAMLIQLLSGIPGLKGQAPATEALFPDSHALDAAICWQIGWLAARGEARLAGDDKEGIIFY